jgi:hypothetical protein
MGKSNVGGCVEQQLGKLTKGNLSMRKSAVALIVTLPFDGKNARMLQT